MNGSGLALSALLPENQKRNRPLFVYATSSERKTSSRVLMSSMEAMLAIV